jgi:uncharacterized RDD family membrane protein YckC
MALRFKCIGCGKMLSGTGFKAGDVIRCGACGEEMKVPADAEETEPEPVRRDPSSPAPVDERSLAGRGHRLGASMIDMLIYIVPLVLISPVKNDEVLYLVAFIGIASIYIVIQVILLTTEGQTVGKMIMEVKIVEVATGRNGGFTTNVLLRTVVNSMICSIPLYWVVDVLFIFREDRRCLHDLIAGTRVVRAKGY